MSLWTWGWLAWGVGFVALEGPAVYLNRRKHSGADRTLSENVWEWFSVKGMDTKHPKWKAARRAALVAFLAWLVAHFLGF